MKHLKTMLTLLITALVGVAGLVFAPAAASAPSRSPIPNDYVLVQGSGWNTPCNCNHTTGYLTFEPNTAVDGYWALKIRAKCTDGSATGGYASEEVATTVDKYTVANGYSTWWFTDIYDNSALYQDTTVGGEVDQYGYFHTPNAIRFRVMAYANTDGYPPAYDPAECQYAIQIWKKVNTKGDWWWKHHRTAAVETVTKRATTYGELCWYGRKFSEIDSNTPYDCLLADDYGPLKREY